MKNIKKLFITIIIAMIFSVSAFAESGFEFFIKAACGLGVAVPSKSDRDAGMKGDIGFDGAGEVQFGYMFQVKDGFGISVLGELGYSVSSFAVLTKISNVSMSLYNSFEGVQVGLLPKFNIGAFAIGIGGGVKIPISGEQTMTAAGIEESAKLNRYDIKEIINPPFLGYVKVSFDYSFFITNKMAVNVGLYLGFDIMKEKVSAGQKSEYFGTFNVGIEFGLKLGNKA